VRNTAPQPPRKRKKARAASTTVRGLDQVLLIEGHETTLRRECRAGFVSVVRHSTGPYAVILRPNYFEQVPISEADFQTLEADIHSAALRQARP
jgi:hypothetical protein